MKPQERPIAESSELRPSLAPPRERSAEAPDEMPDDMPGEMPGQAVTRVLEGDTEAFRTLLEAYEPAVFGLCRRLLFGNMAEAEEVTQETFLRAYKFLGRLEDRNRFAPWLYQIARSLCRDRRRRRLVEERALEERAEMLRRQSLDAERDSTSGSLSRILAELPVEEKNVLMLRYFEGLSYEEVSRRMSLSFSQVDHLIRKARARLAHRLSVRQRIESK